MLGRPNRGEPVFRKSLAGAWLKFSVRTVWITARSSTMDDMCGKTSDTQVPDSPCCRKLRCGPSSLGRSLVKDSMKANRLPSRKESGVAWPSSSLSFGRQSQVSNWLGAPAMNR